MDNDINATIKLKSNAVDSHCSYLTEMETLDAVSILVDGWAVETQPHDVWNDQHDDARHSRLAWETNGKRELAGRVVHATGVHESEGVSHCSRTEHLLPRDWTVA